jgi:hypothetical protein
MLLANQYADTFYRNESAKASWQARDKLHAALTDMCADSLRYQWLRDNRTFDGLDGQIHLEFTCEFDHYDDLDSSIDAAMKRG